MVSLRSSATHEGYATHGEAGDPPASMVSPARWAGNTHRGGAPGSAVRGRRGTMAVMLRNASLVLSFAMAVGRLSTAVVGRTLRNASLVLLLAVADNRTISGG